MGKRAYIYLIADGRRDMQTLLERRLLGARGKSLSLRHGADEGAQSKSHASQDAELTEQARWQWCLHTPEQTHRAIPFGLFP